MYPRWNYDFTGRGRHIKKRPVQFEKQLTEVLFPTYAQQHVLTLARYLDTDEAIMVKIRYGLNPEDFEIIEDIEGTRKITSSHFLHEIDVLDTLSEAGYGPAYIDCATQPAGLTLPYPQGEVDVLVMSRVPGERLGEMSESLSEAQLESIRCQLTEILEYMRQEGYVIFQQDPDFLQYDIENDKLYLVDLTFIDIIDPVYDRNMKQIKPDSMWVLAFGLWREELIKRNPQPKRLLQSAKQRQDGNLDPGQESRQISGKLPERSPPQLLYTQSDSTPVSGELVETIYAPTDGGFHEKKDQHKRQTWCC